MLPVCSMSDNYNYEIMKWGRISALWVREGWKALLGGSAASGASDSFRMRLSFQSDPVLLTPQLAVNKVVSELLTVRLAQLASVKRQFPGD